MIIITIVLSILAIALVFFMMQTKIFRVFMMIYTIAQQLMPFIQARARKQQMSNGNTSNMTKDEAQEILGIDKNASKSTIEKRFKILMKKNHPDSGGSSYITKKIIEAKDILTK